MTTAKEFIKSKSDEYKIDRDLVEDMLIEFANVHVQAALESACKNAIYDYELPDVIDEQSILKAYPLTNIK